MRSSSSLDAIESFRNAMQESGMATTAEIIPDGRLHRIHVVGHRPGVRNGWYVLHLDKYPAGKFGCWKAGVEGSWSLGRSGGLSERRHFESTESPKDPPHRKEEWRESRDDRCQVMASERWSRAKPAEEAGHSYLERKGILPYGTRVLDGALLVPICDVSGKMFSLQSIWADGRKRFLKGTSKRGRHYLIGSPTERILICEGFATGASLHQATGLAVAVAFDCGNLKQVAQALRAHHSGATLVICADNDHQTEGNPGLSHALEAARTIDGYVVSPVFPPGDGGSDFNDMHQREGALAVKSRINEAARPEPEATTVQLPAPSVVAKKSGGPQKDHTLVMPDATPWPAPVDGAALLNELASTVRRFVVCDPATANATALWIAFTWLIDAVTVAPIANITAPAPNCGKSTLLDLLERLTRRPLKVDHVSPAALFRAIDQFKPTLLVDEVDSFLKQNEQARGILNSGHKRNGAVLRVVGDKHELRRFSTWGAKALCGIGSIASTLKSRSIRLELRRKLPEEAVENLRHVDDRIIERLNQQLARFALDSHDAVEACRPAPLTALNNRAQDNWEPLLAIADTAGGEWPSKARSTAIAIEGQEAANDAPDPGVQLLRGIQKVFEHHHADRLTTAELLAGLNADDEGPWATWHQGKPLNSHQLARQLREFRIVPGSIRLGNVTAKGCLATIRTAGGDN